MSFKPYFVQAQLADLKLDRMSSCSRTARYRIQRFATPGTKGDRTSHHGRESYVDAVTAQLTQPEAEKIMALGDEPGYHLWQHPLFRPMLVRIEDLSLPADATIDGYFVATFNLVEHREQAAAGLLPKPSADGAKASADAMFADLGVGLDGLDDIPGTAGDSLSSAWNSFGDAYSDLSEAMDAVSDGEAIWRDVTRALDTVVSTGEALIGAVRGAEEYLEATTQDLIEGVSGVVQTARDAVDTITDLGGATVTYTVGAATDLFGMVRDAGLEATEDVISTVMSANMVEDPFAVLPGTIITMATVVL